MDAVVYVSNQGPYGEVLTARLDERRKLASIVSIFLPSSFSSSSFGRGGDDEGHSTTVADILSGGGGGGGSGWVGGRGGGGGGFVVGVAFGCVKERAEVTH